jgi:hypothetical protein
MSMNEPPKPELPRDEGLEKFEAQLRGFRPSAPRALSIRGRRAPWVMAAAAAILLAVVAPFVVRSHQGPRWTAIARRRVTVERHTVARAVTLGQLNAALRAGDADLNRMLDDASPRLLPREHRGTALFALGKE